jgi:hypothetical protein
MNRNVREENKNQHVLVFLIRFAACSVLSRNRLISAHSISGGTREDVVTQYWATSQHLTDGNQEIIQTY